MSDEFTLGKLLDGNAVFLNCWISAESLAKIIEIHYGMTILPGRNEELSSTSINGFNIGINSLLETKYSESDDVSNEEKLKAAIKVTEFITSNNFQKTLFINGDSIASMPSLYEDEESCKKKDCEMFKKMQPILNRIYEKNGGMYDRNVYEYK